MAEESKLHVAMFPWLAFGHIMPYLELAKLIAQRGHRISFVSTPRNINRLPKIPEDLADSISLVGIPLPRIPELPQDAEATMDIRNEDDPYLKKAHDLLEPGYTRFLEDAVPDWIIFDFSPYWLTPVAEKLGVSRACFSIINAWFLAFLGSPYMMVNGTDPRTKLEDFAVPPPWVPFESKVAYKLYEVKRLFGGPKVPGTGVTDLQRSGLSVQGADTLIVRQSPEFEAKWLTLVDDLYQKPVIRVGFMPPRVEHTESWRSSQIKEWLDGQKAGTVLYVALGTEVALSQRDATELAYGLELSGLPFFWVLRNPSGVTEPIQVPDGYDERIKGRGIVWRDWVPQLNILSHESVGGFLTHCGWSSCIEGLSFGLPFVMLPFLVDQGLNARVMEENKVGAEIKRDEEDGSFRREWVSEAVRLVMLEDEGQIFRSKAKELSRIFGDRDSHGKCIDDFIQYLVTHRKGKTQ